MEPDELFSASEEFGYTPVEQHCACYTWRHTRGMCRKGDALDGYVYVLGHPKGTVKIGMSERASPFWRAHVQSGERRAALSVRHFITTSRPRMLEKEIHRALAPFQTRDFGQREWFRVPAGVLVALRSADHVCVCTEASFEEYGTSLVFERSGFLATVREAVIASLPDDELERYLAWDVQYYEWRPTRFVSY
jgi:hypothetical protein